MRQGSTAAGSGLLKPQPGQSTAQTKSSSKLPRRSFWGIKVPWVRGLRAASPYEFKDSQCEIHWPLQDWRRLRRVQTLAVRLIAALLTPFMQMCPTMPGLCKVEAIRSHNESSHQCAPEHMFCSMLFHAFVRSSSSLLGWFSPEL